MQARGAPAFWETWGCLAIEIKQGECQGGRFGLRHSEGWHALCPYLLASRRTGPLPGARRTAYWFKDQGVTTMTPRFPTASLFGALAAFLWVSNAWAGDAAAVREDAVRAMQRGERLIQEGHYKDAAAEFERASDLAGGPCPDCLLGAARAYSGARQYEAALPVTRMALALCSAPEDQARAYEQLGTI